MARGGSTAAISMRVSPLFRSFAHRAKGDAAKQMLPQQDGEDEDRNEEQGRCGRDRRQVLTARADDERNERRHGLRLAAGEQDRKAILVPGAEQAGDGGYRKYGRSLRQYELAE